MSTTLDGVLVQWGDRLFYPSSRMTASHTPVLTEAAIRQRAQALRQRGFSDLAMRRDLGGQPRVSGGRWLG